MRSTALRLSMTFPAAYPIAWPAACGSCGDRAVAGTLRAARGAPPVPYCKACMRTQRRWTTWIAGCLAFGLLMVLGPVLLVGVGFDRPLPSLDTYHNFGLQLMMVAIFLSVISAIAAGIGYVRRSELQGVQLQPVAIGAPDDPSAPLATEAALVEVRFRSREFYSATLDMNRAPGG